MSPPKSKTQIFVFRSNLAGRHGKGAALEARKKWGAIRGQGEGPQGNSYAIPTKDERLKPLDIDLIRGAAQRFVAFATSHHDLEFLLTRVGCGLAGYTDEEIAPMFVGAPANVKVPPEWKPYLKQTARKPRKR